MCGWVWQGVLNFAISYSRSSISDLSQNFNKQLVAFQCTPHNAKCNNNNFAVNFCINSTTAA